MSPYAPLSKEKRIKSLADFVLSQSCDEQRNSPKMAVFAGFGREGIPPKVVSQNAKESKKESRL
jgi:hypothetical protein